ncbi:MAG: MerR family transcriptional regulator [Acidimicrobiales bacterium]
MTTDTTRYTIGEVADRTGFSASALRYYEGHGLVEPVDRTDAGYRLYDDSSVGRLQFIARAKELSCSLEEIADLADLWAADDCGPVQRRLHELVTDKVADAQRRSAELLRFTAQLQTAAAHLGGDPVDGACGEACACLGGESPTADSVPVMFGEHSDPAIACTLPADQMVGRTDDWQRMMGHVIAKEALPAGETGVRLVLDPAAPLAELTCLAVAEQGCCAFFSFAITVDGRGIALEVRVPADSEDLLEELLATLFGTVS